MTHDSPGYALDQAIKSTLHQDWQLDFANPYDAMEDWFREAEEWPENIEPIVSDIDLLFAETEDAQARWERWPRTGLTPQQTDDLLRAMRKRAVDGLAGNAEPMRAP